MDSANKNNPSSERTEPNSDAPSITKPSSLEIAYNLASLLLKQCSQQKEKIVALLDRRRSNKCKADQNVNFVNSSLTVLNRKSICTSINSAPKSSSLKPSGKQPIRLGDEISMSGSTMDTLQHYVDSEFHELNMKFESLSPMSDTCSCNGFMKCSNFDYMETVARDPPGDFCDQKTRRSINVADAKCPKHELLIQELDSSVSSGSTDEANVTCIENIKSHDNQDQDLSLTHIADILDKAKSPRVAVDNLLKINENACRTKVNHTVDTEKPCPAKRLESSEEKYIFDNVVRPSNGWILHNLKTNIYIVPKYIRQSNELMADTKMQIVHCLAGVEQNARVKIKNNREQWLLVSVKSYSVQNKSNIKLAIPSNIILIKPSETSSFGFKLEMPEAGKVAHADIEFIFTDMVTREECVTCHSLTFISEEHAVHVTGKADDGELDFGIIDKTVCAILPVVINNNNNVDVTVEAQILQDESAKVFFLCSSDDDDDADTRDRFPVNSHQTITKYVKFQGTDPGSLSKAYPRNEKDMYSVRSKLRFSLSVNDVSFASKEMDLAGCIGQVDVRLQDATLPITAQQHHFLSLQAKNHGNVAAATTFEVLNKGKLDPYFIVVPEKVSIRPGERVNVSISYSPWNLHDLERHSTLTITTDKGVQSYPLVGVQSSHVNQEKLINHVTYRNNNNNHISSAKHHSRMQARAALANAKSSGLLNGLNQGPNCPDAVSTRSAHITMNWTNVRVEKHKKRQKPVRLS